MKLILDFVPNHVALDHPWVADHPEYFILGSHDAVATVLTESGGTFYALGRDPYFPAWPDVLQLNAFAPGLRQAAMSTVSSIAEQCDGIRCDMAMLFLNDIFERTWGERAGPHAGNGILDRSNLSFQTGISRFPLYCRSLLGHRVATSTAGFRFLLRQETLRSTGARQRIEHSPAPACGSKLSGKIASVHREP